MKKYASFYAASLFICFSLAAQAMEKKPLEELQEIAMRAFPPALYESGKDCTEADREKLREARLAAQEGVIIFDLPVEIFFHHIFPYMPSKALLSSCHFFHKLSSLSFFSLNEYCLTETRPHTIPLPLLRFKILNTKDGIFKLAEFMSVSAKDLADWFSPDDLKAAFLPYQQEVPEKLEGQSEEKLGKHYPILKIALASSLVDTTDATNPVMKLLQEYREPYGLSLNKMRLLSLNPARPGVYYETLQQMILAQHAYSSASDSQARNVIARELLIAGKEITFINNNFFVGNNPDNPQKRETAIQILELCINNPQFYHNYQSCYLIDDALSLERPDLALKILRKVVDFPNDENSFPCKIQSFLHYKDCEIEDSNIQSSIRQFSANLYSYWGQIAPGLRFLALSLLIQADRREEVRMAVDDILLQPEENILKFFQSTLFNDLSDNHYLEEARKLACYLLNIETGKLVPIFQYSVADIFTQFIKIDRKKSIALLKIIVESSQVQMRGKLSALHFLAEHASEEIDREKSTILVKAFVESDQINMDGKLDAHLFLARHALEEIERKESIAHLKALIESDEVNLMTKMGFLVILLQHTNEEADYVMSQVKALNYQEKDKDIVEPTLCFIYNRLNNSELCHFYYKKLVQHRLDKTTYQGIKKRDRMMKELQEGGLNITCFADLLECNPSTVLDIMLAKKGLKNY